MHQRPRVAASLGFSGSRSITRNRYSNGHCMKSLAREGDNDAGAMATRSTTPTVPGSTVTAAARSAAAPSSPAVPATPSALVSMPTDLTARH